VDVGKSLAAEWRTQVTTIIHEGQGDRGDGKAWRWADAQLLAHTLRSKQGNLEDSYQVKSHTRTFSV
jgi:hypothetical protein